MDPSCDRRLTPPKSCASKMLRRVGRFHLRAQRQLANLRCCADAPKGSLRSGAGPPFWREGFASECISFTPHFHEFFGL